MSEQNLLRIAVVARDQSCRLKKVLTPEELKELEKNPFTHTLDTAHVFGRGPHPHMADDLDNVVLMNRYSHTNLDQGKHPLRDELITSEERELWWKRILKNDELYLNLKRKSKRG